MYQSAVGIGRCTVPRLGVGRWRVCAASKKHDLSTAFGVALYCASDTSTQRVSCDAGKALIAACGALASALVGMSLTLPRELRAEVTQPSALVAQRRSPCPPPGNGHGADAAALPKWLKSNGGYACEALEVVEFAEKGFGLRLSTASTVVPAGAVILRVPRALVLDELEEDVEDERSQTLAPSPLFQGEELPKASQRLRARLAKHWLSSSPDSPFFPWLLCVWPPPALPVMLLSTSAGEESLRGTVLHKHAHALRAAIARESAASASGQTQKNATVARLWAQAVLMSRAYQLPKAGSSAARLVLAPVIDIANSAQGHDFANAKLRAEPDGSVSLVAVHPIHAGEEVLTCYGEFENEQLLFTYGYVQRGNRRSGPVCPLAPPTEPSHAALWSNVCAALLGGSDGANRISHDGLARLRLSDSCAKQGTDTASSAVELLALLRVLNLSDAEAVAILDRNQEIGLMREDGALAVGLAERVQAARLLADWEDQLLAAVGTRARSLEPHEVEALRPAWWLQDETLCSVQQARAEVVQSLPITFRVNWVLRDAFSTARRRASVAMRGGA